MSENKNMKVRVHALFHRLQINKNIKFQTHILWKRGQNKIQSKMVNHEKGFSIFQQQLTLDFNLLYNQTKAQFDDKNTQIVAIIMYDGRTKSGGYAKYNIAQVINDNLDGKVVTIPLKQCPDPNAHVEVTFHCEYLQQQGDTVSVINGGDREMDISRVNFHDDKISMEIDRINSTIAKLADLAKSVNAKERGNAGEGAEQSKKIQMLESEKQMLVANTKKLEAEIIAKEKESNDKLKAEKKIISELQKQLSKKEKDYKIIQFGQLQEEKRYKEELSKNQKQLYKYKTLYEDTLAELKLNKNSQIRASIGFGRMEIDDALDIPKFETSKQDSDHEQEKPKQQKEVVALKAQNNELQTSLANMSYKLAQLFNSAYEYGGAKLLDYLQTSIGLTQF